MTRNVRTVDLAIVEVFRSHESVLVSIEKLTYTTRLESLESLQESLGALF
jgi:hypothetical protein